MSESRRAKLYRKCRRKVPYSSAYAAKRVIKAKGWSAHPYVCPYDGSHWHITSKGTGRGKRLGTGRRLSDVWSGGSPD